MNQIFKDNVITTFDTLILYCTINGCPVGDEDSSDGPETGCHKVFDVSSECFDKYLSNRIEKVGFHRFRREACLLFEGEFSQYVIVDDSGNIFPATTEDFNFIKEEVEEWCLRHVEVA